MSSKQAMDSYSMGRLLRAEYLIAIFVTAASVFLHIHNATHVGPLWRDEVNSVEIAKMPLHDILQHLQYDSFPILWLCALKSVLSLNLGGDTGLRIFGCGVGIMALVSLWWSARVFRTTPLLALILIGLNPTIIRWGDSIRGNGLGMIFAIALLPTLWILLEQPSKKQFAISLLICLVAVQLNYYNSLLLFATLLAGVFICIIRKTWRISFLLGLLGFLCALSMAPYFFVMKKAAAGNILTKISDFNISRFCNQLTQALGPFGPKIDLLIWLAFILIAIILVFLQIVRTKRILHCQIFLLASISIGTIVYYGFLKWLNYSTNPWYYIVLLGFLAIPLNVCILSAPKHTWIYAGILGMGFILTTLCFFIARPQLNHKITNIDILADYLKKHADSNDYIIIIPWEPGITFQRYYTGNTDWTVVPQIPHIKFHYYDLVKAAMAQDLQITMQPILDHITSTLKSGGKIWILGPLWPPPGYVPFTLPPAPHSKHGWKIVPYYCLWAQSIGTFLRDHARRSHRIPIPCGPVSLYEYTETTVAEGWRE